MRKDRHLGPADRHPLCSFGEIPGGKRCAHPRTAFNATFTRMMTNTIALMR
jgi:hypothetical protein